MLGGGGGEGVQFGTRIPAREVKETSLSRKWGEMKHIDQGTVVSARLAVEGTQSGRLHSMSSGEARLHFDMGWNVENIPIHKKRGTHHVDRDVDVRVSRWPRVMGDITQLGREGKDSRK